ncbi:MAG TPA: hypothetical protein VIJ23_04235, partial [Mycobacterium sp.]
DQRCGKEHPAREAGGAGHGGSPLLGNSFLALRFGTALFGTALLHCGSRHCGSRQVFLGTASRQLGEPVDRTAPAIAASGAILQ